MFKPKPYSVDQNTAAKNAGFTLIELVVTLVVSGILAIGTVAFISRTVEGLDSAASRNKLASAGRTAISRMSLELHNALPNSIRTAGSDQCIEFVPVRAATTYIDPAFANPAKVSFDVVDFVEENAVFLPSAPPLLYGVIYPRNSNQVYDGDNGTAALPVVFNNRSPVQAISVIADHGSITDLSTVTLTTAHRFRRRSPNERFFVVTQPVSFCIVGEKLYRYSNYGFHQNQTVIEESGSCDAATANRCLPNYANHTTTPNKVLIVDSISSGAFTVGNQNLERNSLVSIELNFASDLDSIALKNEVLTRSVP
jgi:MSHA biogenesis protein MshO